MTNLVEASIDELRGVWDRDGQLLGALGPDGSVVQIGASAPMPTGSGTGWIGDSFTFNNTGGGVSGLTLTRTGDVVVVTGMANHPVYPGGNVTVLGCADVADDAVDVPVIDWLSASSFSYRHDGKPGVILAGPQSISIQWKPLQQGAGVFSHLNRYHHGGLRIDANCGVAGARLAEVAKRVQKVFYSKRLGRVYGLAGYNDILAGTSVDDFVSTWRSIVDMVPGVFFDIFSPAPWNAGAAADSVANRRKLQRFYPALKDEFSREDRVRVHNTPAILGQSNGYAATGMIKLTDNIHLAPRGCATLAKYLYGLDQVKPTPMALPYTALDTRANDASSEYLIDNPLMVTAGGAVTNMTGTFPLGSSGTLGGTGAAGTSALVARADGVGNDWVITYTPTNADWNLRASFEVPTGRFTPGATMDIMARVSLSGLSGGNAAKLKTFQMLFVWVDNGRTYGGSVQEASGVNESVDHVLPEDLDNVILCIRDVPVPLFTALTTARLDFVTNHYASSATAVVLKIAQVQVRVRV